MSDKTGGGDYHGPTLSHFVEQDVWADLLHQWVYEDGIKHYGYDDVVKTGIEHYAGHDVFESGIYDHVLKPIGDFFGKGW